MMRRREFLGTLGRAGAGALVVGALPAWAGAPAQPDLIVRNTWPEHYETALDALGRSWVTANERFFVRSHFPVPDVDQAAYRLEVSGLVKTPLSLTLAELRALPQFERAHTLECAGNGRGLYKLANTAGTQWEYGAVGNAKWGGTPLLALLERAGVQPEAKHVWFEAADRAPLPEVPPFLRSIPIEKAMDDVLLVHRMNGAPLPKLHGAPVRVIVPGWYGMASTKWVTRVRVEAAPSDNHWIARGYHYVYPGEDPAQAPPVQEMRVKSLITGMLENGRAPKATATVKGFAWAGRPGVQKVEISTDGGATWRGATLEGEEVHGAWRAWSAKFDVTTAGVLHVMARATDGDGDVQPAQAKPNASGYGNNSIHERLYHVL